MTSAGPTSTNSLSKGERTSERRQTSTAHIQGRKLFGADAHFTHIASRFENGATVKQTRLTPAFTIQDFFGRHGESAIIMFVVKETRELEIVTAERCEARAGDLIVALVDSQDVVPAKENTPSA